jgi:NADH-quinone oxidoreductase subunit M
MLPLATETYGPTILGTMGVFAILYGGLSALAQSDLRLLLAYSSLSHVGFITLGMFSLTPEGVAGAALQMFNHGVTTAAMFLLAGCWINRRGTANIQNMGSGLAAIYPRMAVLTIYFLMAGAGMPGASNFVGELLALSGMMVKYPSLAGAAIVGVLLGAWYSLKLAKDILFGKAQSSNQRRTRQFDLSLAEWLPLATMVALSLYIGLWPQGVLGTLQNDTNRLTHHFENNDASVAVNSIRSTEQATATALKSATKLELPH